MYASKSIRSEHFVFLADSLKLDIFITDTPSSCFIATLFLLLKLQGSCYDFLSFPHKISFSIGVCMVRAGGSSSASTLGLVKGVLGLGVVLLFQAAAEEMLVFRGAG